MSWTNRIYAYLNVADILDLISIQDISRKLDHRSVYVVHDYMIQPRAFLNPRPEHVRRDPADLMCDENVEDDHRWFVSSGIIKAKDIQLEILCWTVGLARWMLFSSLCEFTAHR